MPSGHPFQWDEIEHDLKFLQENAPLHTADLMKDWFEQENIVVITWPVSSSNLNMIQNVRRMLKQFMHYPKQPTSCRIRYCGKGGE